MELEELAASIEAEWEPESGFFWRVRQGVFAESEFARTLTKFASVPSTPDRGFPARLIAVLWYAPLLMQWQVDRVREHGGDVSAYVAAMNRLTTEVERILGVP